ncbi:MAG: hypothetical protein NTZ51_10965 [Proteobacteria bacterium]|nr:hypothetical protein [Pseudomonadota bacterium]
MHNKKLLSVFIIMIMLGCGGCGGHKKYRIGDQLVKALPFADQRMRALFDVWRAASLTKAGIDTGLYAVQRKNGEEELKELKAAASRGPRELSKALKHYHYKPDPIAGKLDTITLPWVTCIKKYGDCDDSAWLCAALMPGSIYDIMEFKGRFIQGHLVFVSSGGDVFSNFKLDGNINDPRQLGKKYNKHWTHIIKVSNDIRVENVIAR